MDNVIFFFKKNKYLMVIFMDNVIFYIKKDGKFKNAFY